MGSALPRRLTEFLRRRVDDRRPAERPRVLVRRDGDAARHFRNIWRHRQPSAELLLARPVQKVTVNILLVNIHRTHEGCRRSSVDSFAPSILPPRVRFPSTPSMLFSI